MLSPIELSISKKLEDKEYRHRFFLGRAQDETAAQLREWRKKRGQLTQTELADLSGTKQSAISRIEKASYSGWTFTTLWRIARILDLRVRIVFEPMEDVIREYKERERIVRQKQAEELSIVPEQLAISEVAESDIGNELAGKDDSAGKAKNHVFEMTLTKPYNSSEKGGIYAALCGRTGQVHSVPGNV